MSDESDKKDKSIDALDLRDDAGTKTIRATFRQKVKALHSGEGGPISKKSFQELNEAYQFLMQDRARQSSLQKKKVTILSSDVAGYSKMMAENEQATLEFFGLCKEIFEEKVNASQGRVFNTAGDAILAEFGYPYNAVHCAMEIQKELRALNHGQPDHLKIQFRIGVNQGEVFVQEEGDLLGDAVNIAARIQTVAKPGGVCISDDLHELIRNRVTYSFTSLGPQSFKNIPQPVVTWAVTESAGAKAPPPDPKIVAFEAPPKAVAPATTRTREKKATDYKRLAKPAAIVAALAVAAGWYLTRPAPVPKAATTQSADPASTGKGSGALVGHFFLSTTPDTTVTLVRDGLTEFTGKTPVQVDLKPGKYKIHIENPEYEILEERAQTIEAGKEYRIEQGYSNKKRASGPNFAVGGSSQFTPLEDDLKKNAEAGDVESLYRLGKSRLDKGSFEDAYTYLKMAAAKGHPTGQFELGKLFYSGRLEGGRNFDAAIYWIIKAGLDGAQGATDFLTANSFPPEYSMLIQNQRRVSGDAKGQRAREAQVSFLEGLKEKLSEKNLPH